MKMLLLVVACAAAASQPPLPAPDPALVQHFRLALEAVFGVSVRLQAFLQEGGNFLVSPVSTATILGQLVLGAEGDFQKQLVELLALPNSHLYENDVIQYHNKRKNVTYYLPYSTLHLQLSNLLKALESDQSEKKHFVLKEKSAIFVDQRVKLNDTFQKGVRSLYEARLVVLDFLDKSVEAQRLINNWVKHNTNGLIPSILAAPPPPTTSAVFANAIYFKADWATPFSDVLNRDGLFNVSPTKTVPVTFMINQLDQILYSEGQGYRIVALPYTNEETAMYFLLPTADNPYKYDMKGFVNFLKFSDVIDTIRRAKRRDVVVKIPKMTLSSSFSILDQLKKYRSFKEEEVQVNATNIVDKLEDKVEAFEHFNTTEENEIYLSAAAIGKSLKVSDIIQQVVITVNEKGTEAAAVSVGTIDYMGGAKNFIVDRPFVFFIRHEPTSASLFWGAISNPVA